MSVLPLPVGYRGSPLDRDDVDQLLVGVDVEEDPPGADPFSVGGALVRELLDVPGLRIDGELSDRREEPVTLVSWRAAEYLSRPVGG